MNRAVIDHYDRLIELDNDPVRDPQPLRDYMDKWDGVAFLERLRLDGTQSALEIGVGTGRLAQRIAPKCARLCGIDLSPKTISRARENLAGMENVDLFCGDFLKHDFSERFDLICSSLTFMHIRQKREAVEKIASLLNPGGRAVISIDKSRQPFIDAGFGRLEIFPDEPLQLEMLLCEAGLKVEPTIGTEFAIILSACKN